MFHKTQYKLSRVVERSAKILGSSIMVHFAREIAFCWFYRFLLILQENLTSS